MGTSKQPHPFNPHKAAILDDAAREQWLPTDALLQLLQIGEETRILDYGTGTARYAIRAALLNPDARIVAYDVQKEMLQIVRDRVREHAVVNVTVVGPDPEALSGPFDRVMAVNVLHEIDDDDLQRIRSVLHPEGFALFVDWNSSIQRDFGPPANHTYTVEEAIARLEAHGFAVEPQEDGRFPYHFVMVAGIR